MDDTPTFRVDVDREKASVLGVSLTDVDQTFLGTLSSVIGSTMVNTLRLSYTSEILHFANPTFLDNGFDQIALLPTLVHPSFEDGQSPAVFLDRGGVRLGAQSRLGFRAAGGVVRGLL